MYSLGPIGHLSRVKTLNLLNQTYQWLDISQFIATFVKDCALCFYIKTPCLAPLSFLKPLKLLVRPQADISINYIVDLPKYLYNSKIYKHIFVVIDCLIKIRHFIPITSLNIEELIKAFIYTIYKLYSALNTIISDRGSLFIFDFQRRLNQRLKVTLNLSSTQYPKINGQTEIINAAINKYLYAFISFI